MITADGNDKMQCNCPYCGQQLLVNLPTLASPVTPTVQQPVMNEDEKKDGGSTLKIILTILIVLILGGLAAFGYIYWDSQKKAAQWALQAHRKAHADSVMQVRAQIEAQEAEAQRQDEKRKGICRFLESFYKKAVLTDDADADFYSRYLTDYCHRMVFGPQGSYDYDVDEATIWWGAFGNTATEPDYEQLQRNLKVVAVDDNWFKVRLSQDGETEYRQVKVLSQDGHILIDDVK
nr:hypothetical protein [uncultured Prevotella sp.]